MPDVLQQLQLDIAAALGAEEDFYYVPVLVWRPRDAGAAVAIRNALNNALLGVTKKNGKAGIGCMAMMPDAEVPDANVPGPQFDLIAVVRVFENQTFNEGANGTHISAEQCALNALAALHWMNPGSGVILADRKALRDASAPDGSIAYDVVVRQSGGLNPRPFVQRPAIAVADPQMTITCGTSGAAIYWTSDGTLPTPTNGTLYTAPVDVGELGTATIRARAYLTGKRASDCASFDL